MFVHVAGTIFARLETIGTHRSLLERHADTQGIVWRVIADLLGEMFPVALVSGVYNIRHCWQEHLMFCSEWEMLRLESVATCDRSPPQASAQASI